MKRFLSILLATALIIGILPVIPVVATTSGGFGAYTTITGEDGFEMGYKVWTPDNFDPANNEYKLLIFFHSAGVRGNTGSHISGTGTAFMRALMATGRFVILAPQCPSGYRWATASDSWWNESIYDLTTFEETKPMSTFINFLETEFFSDYNIDTDDVVVTGCSMGGFATWYMASKYPQYVSIAIPVCGGADPTNMPALLRDTHIYMFHTEEDTTINVASSDQMYSGLQNVGADVTYRRYDTQATTGHEQINGANLPLDLRGPDYEWFWGYSNFGGSKNWAHWAWEPAYGEKDILLSQWVIDRLDSKVVSYASDASMKETGTLWNSSGSDSNITYYSDGKTHGFDYNVGSYQFDDSVGALRVYYYNNSFMGLNQKLCTFVNKDYLTLDDKYIAAKYYVNNVSGSGTVPLKLVRGNVTSYSIVLDQNVAANSGNWVTTDVFEIADPDTPTTGTMMNRFVTSNYNGLGLVVPTGTSLDFWLKEIRFFDSAEAGERFYSSYKTGIVPPTVDVLDEDGGVLQSDGSVWYDLVGDNNFQMGYQVWYPDNFCEEVDYKLIIYFHDSDDRGTGPLGRSLTDSSFFNDLMNTERFVLVVPRCPEGYRWAASSDSWYANSSYDMEIAGETIPMKTFMEAIRNKFLPKNSNIDPENVIVTGNTMGGFGALYAASAYNDMVSVAIPVSGGCDPLAMSHLLKNTHIYAFNCEEDTIVSVQGADQLVANLTSLGADVKYRRFDALTGDISATSTDIPAANRGLDYELLNSNDANWNSSWTNHCVYAVYNEADCDLSTWVMEKVGLANYSPANVVSFEKYSETSKKVKLMKSNTSDVTGTGVASSYTPVVEAISFSDGIGNSFGFNAGHYGYTTVEVDGTSYGALQVVKEETCASWSAGTGNKYNYRVLLFAGPGKFDSNDKFIRVKYLVKNLSGCSDAIPLRYRYGNGSAYVTLDNDITGNVGQWVISEPVQLTQALIDRFAKAGSNAICFDAPEGVSLDFYIGAVSFFDSKEAAWDYYGGEQLTLSLSNQSAAQSNSRVFNNSYITNGFNSGFPALNVGDYYFVTAGTEGLGMTVDRNALLINENSESCAAFVKDTSSEYYRHRYMLRMNAAKYFDSFEEVWMTVKFKANSAAAAAYSNVFIMGSKKIVLHSGTINADEWVITAPICLRGESATDDAIAQMARFAGGIVHNGLFFTTKSVGNDAKFLVSEVMFFDSEKQANKYAGIAKSENKNIVKISYESPEIAATQVHTTGSYAGTSEGYGLYTFVEKGSTVPGLTVDIPAISIDKNTASFANWKPDVVPSDATTAISRYYRHRYSIRFASANKFAGFDEVYMRVKFKTNTAGANDFTKLTLLTGSTPDTAVLYDKKPEADKWIVTEPVLIDNVLDNGTVATVVRDGLLNRFNNASAQNGLFFETHSNENDTKFMISEITFFSSKELAYAYYGDYEKVEPSSVTAAMPTGTNLVAGGDFDTDLPAVTSDTAKWIRRITDEFGGVGNIYGRTNGFDQVGFSLGSENLESGIYHVVLYVRANTDTLLRPETAITNAASQGYDLTYYDAQLGKGMGIRLRLVDSNGKALQLFPMIGNSYSKNWTRIEGYFDSSDAEVQPTLYIGGGTGDRRDVGDFYIDNLFLEKVDAVPAGFTAAYINSLGTAVNGTPKTANYTAINPMSISENLSTGNIFATGSFNEYTSAISAIDSGADDVNFLTDDNGGYILVSNIADGTSGQTLTLYGDALPAGEYTLTGYMRTAVRGESSRKGITLLAPDGSENTVADSVFTDITNNWTKIEYTVDAPDGLSGQIILSGEIASNTEAYCFDNISLSLIDSYGIKGAQPVINESITIGFYANVSDSHTAGGAPKMTFEMPGVEGKEAATVEGSVSGGEYLFAYSGVLPQNMSEKIVATLKTSDDKVIGTKEYSMTEYCMNQLARAEEGSELETLLLDMLEYGKQAQIFAGIDDADATSELTAEQLAKIAERKVAFESELDSIESVSGVTGEVDQSFGWTSETLVLKDVINLRFRFVVGSDLINNISIKVTIGSGIDARESLFTYDNIDPKLVIMSDGNGGYYVDFSDVSACEFGTPITAQCFVGETQLGQSVSYSVNSYIKNKYQNAADSSQNPLVIAIYNYGKSSKAYAEASGNH